jgi:hypothetical protein
MIHLEGMGILGSYIALRLEQEGMPFTWHDSRLRVNAWWASTGAIFPSGDADDQWALDVWREHLGQDGFADFMEEANYVYCTKNPPHGGRYTSEELVPGIRLAELSSLHVNASQFVLSTRMRFRLQELSVPDGERLRQGDTEPNEYVVTHGFGARLERFMWGWTIPVRVRTRPSDLTVGLRAALYMRHGRFTMAYAYPIPGTDMWYSGSSLISQHEPKELDIDAKFKRWRNDFMELSGGFVTGVSRAGQPRQGWRPVPGREDKAWVRRTADGLLGVRPLWHSGIRQAPLVYAALCKEL